MRTCSAATIGIVLPSPKKASMVFSYLLPSSTQVTRYVRIKITITIVVTAPQSTSFHFTSLTLTHEQNKRQKKCSFLHAFYAIVQVCTHIYYFTVIWDSSSARYRILRSITLRYSQSTTILLRIEGCCAHILPFVPQHYGTSCTSCTSSTLVVLPHSLKITTKIIYFYCVTKLGLSVL